MNLPNKLTLMRVILIPFFVLFALWEFSSVNLFIALLIFAIASITDMLDGKIARSRNLITNFGKFLDPLADKALVMAALLVFVDKNWVSSVPVMIILFREFMVSALRLVVKSGDGIVVAAGWLGKVKTAFTMVAIVVTLFLHALVAVGVGIDGTVLSIIDNLLVWVAAILTAVSGVQYLWAYRSAIDTNE
ncbi:MAG: CDP-diacylglycerol--glycerol-3-phosphate 3-phosphatidyltransferase [Oscillospiraceae bacterium]|nr:CDP-diacylglycerol--glycerol-3-phosphate 3-phosphatidyltransferase [Oscillospiraceae bacterium]